MLEVKSAYPAGLRLPEFVKFSGEDTRITFERISQYLAQLGEAGSINELDVRLFSLFLTGTTFHGLVHWRLIWVHGNN